MGNRIYFRKRELFLAFPVAQKCFFLPFIFYQNIQGTSNALRAKVDSLLVSTSYSDTQIATSMFLKVAYIKVVLQYHIIICEPNLTPAKNFGLRLFQLTNFQTYTNRRLIDLGGVNLTATPIFD